MRREIEKASFTFISRPIENANRSLLPIEKANRSLLCLMNAPQAIEAVEWIEKNAAPEADVVIYAGDFNTESGDLPHR